MQSHVADNLHICKILVTIFQQYFCYKIDWLNNFSVYSDFVVVDWYVPNWCASVWYKFPVIHRLPKESSVPRFCLCVCSVGFIDSILFFGSFLDSIKHIEDSFVFSICLISLLASVFIGLVSESIVFQILC